MPIYNDSELIEKSISSILNQSLDDIEIICVDDGSSDNSLDVLKDYASDFDFIKVFSQENQGSGKARNLGISKAEGEYIGFLDADDYFISEDALDKLYEVASKHDADMVTGNIKLVDENGNFSPFTHLEYYQEYKAIQPEEYGIPWSFYKNIYKREFLTDNHIEFPDLIRGQDPVFLAEILSKLDVVYTVPVDVYAYFYVDGSKKVDTYRKIHDHMLHYKMVFDYLNDSKFNSVVHKFYHEMMGFFDLMGPQKANWVLKAIQDIFCDEPEILNRCEEYFYLKYKDIEDLRDLVEFKKDPLNPRISVIMPMDNLDNNFEKAVNSILNQTFDDFELICFNDLNSNQIIKKFSKDSRIKISNDITSLNDALNISKGDYVYFFNPKANMKTFALEELYKNAICNNSDVVLFMLAKYLRNNRIDYKHPVYNLHEYFDNITYHLFTFNHDDIKPYVFKNFVVWNKFYKKEYLQRYDDFNITKVNQDDILFNVKSLLRTNFISFAADYYYIYYGQDYESLNTDYNIFDIIEEVESFLKNEGYFENLKNEFSEFKINQIISYLDSSNSQDYFNYSKELLLEIDNDVEDLSQETFTKYSLVMDSNDIREYKIKNDVYSRFNQQINSSCDDIYELMLTNNELIKINKFLLDENDKLNKKIRKLNKANKDLKEKNSKLNNLNKEFTTSTSWKVTKPMRNFKKLL